MIAGRKRELRPRPVDKRGVEQGLQCHHVYFLSVSLVLFRTTGANGVAHGRRARTFAESAERGPQNKEAQDDENDEQLDGQHHPKRASPRHGAETVAIEAPHGREKAEKRSGHGCTFLFLKRETAAKRRIKRYSCRSGLFYRVLTVKSAALSLRISSSFYFILLIVRP